LKPSSDSGLYLGAGKNIEKGDFFSGLIDDVRIYDDFTLDLSYSRSIIITNGRKNKIRISISRRLAMVAGRGAIQEMSPLTHAILIKQVRFRIDMTQSDYPH